MYRTERAMFPISWFDRDALISGKLTRYLAVAAWTEIPAVFAAAFLWYCWYLNATDRPTPLRYLAVRILLGISGACGALAGVFLSEAMWEFWKNYDASPPARKKTWRWIMSVFVIFGCTAYFHVVYLPQVEQPR